MGVCGSHSALHHRVCVVHRDPGSVVQVPRAPSQDKMTLKCGRLQNCRDVLWLQPSFLANWYISVLC